MHIIELTFLVFVGIQVVYLAIFLKAFNKVTVDRDKLSVPVSVIVCAHDEEQNLRELIPLLLAQDYGEFEIIVVEDRSNDGSFDFLYKVASENDRLRMIPVKSKPEHVNGKKFALTLGIKAAKFEWVLLTDADCLPGSNQWINEMSSQFLNSTDIVLGYSPYIKSPGFLNSFIRYEGLTTAIQYTAMAILGKPYMGVGRNLAYRKNVFLDNKGFRSHLSVTGGDDDLFINEVSRKDNTKVCAGAGAVVYTKPKTTWSDFYFQKLRHLSVGKHYKTIDKLRLGIFNFTLIGFWVLIVPALLYSSVIYVPIAAILLRLVLLVLLAYTASRKLGDAFESWKAPFLDFIFSIYYLVIGLVALLTNKVRWKKT
ncbi:MAG: glycosyltransferase [Cyclobacteriaceae bacterium]